jgi:hypothetical protein
MFEAFKATLDYGNHFHDEEGKWIHKFSYFYELFRRPQLKEWAKDGKNMVQFMELISGEKPRLSTGSQVRDLPTILADKKAFGFLLSDGYERAHEVLKAKRSKIDRDSKTLEQAAEVLLELTRNPAKLSTDPKKARVLGQIKERADYLLSKSLPRPRSLKR